jgi:hypothetical protein
MVLKSDVERGQLSAAAAAGIAFALLMVGVLLGVGLMWARKLRRRRLKWEARRAMTSLDVVHGEEGEEEGDLGGGFQFAASEGDDGFGPDSGYVMFDRATDRVEGAARVFVDSVRAMRQRVFGGGGGGGGEGQGGARGFQLLT